MGDNSLTPHPLLKKAFPHKELYPELFYQFFYYYFIIIYYLLLLLF